MGGSSARRGVGMIATSLAAGALVVVALAACSEPTPDAPSEVAGAESSPSRVASEPEDVPPSPDSWPSDVEDLSASLARFESVDACLVALRAQTPTAVAEGIGDLGYDGFFEDVCRATEAVVARDVERCDALAVSSVRRGCRRRLAIVAGDPLFCPDDPVIEGREPLCVAWAARDPGLCRSASTGERSACAAVLAGDPAQCRRDPDRARCEAWVRRYASSLGTERPPAAADAIEPSLHLVVTPLSPPPPSDPTHPSPEPIEGTPFEVDLDVLARGVRLVADGCVHRVILDERGARAQLPVGRAGARIDFPIAPGLAPTEAAPSEIAIAPGGAGIVLSVPDHGRASGGEGSIALTALGRTRGSPIAGTISATMPMGVGSVRVGGTFSTFVRDLDRLPEACSGDRMPAP